MWWGWGRSIDFEGWLRRGNPLDDAPDVAYHLGGNLSSSIHGEPRATNDVDLVIDALVAALGADFAIDRESLVEAARSRASCNIFCLPLFTKIDLFVSPREAVDSIAPW